jgi:hypothetical protein
MNGGLSGGSFRSRMSLDGRMPPRTASAADATGLRGNLHNYAPGSAGNEARDTDVPRRLRIRARHSWNPSVTDVIVNTLSHIGVLGPDTHRAFTMAWNPRSLWAE